MAIIEDIDVEFTMSVDRTEGLPPRKGLRHGHTLLNDINYRIKRNRKLTLMMIGYRGDALIEMHKMLFGRKPKSNRLLKNAQSDANPLLFDCDFQSSRRYSVCFHAL